jgi:hypothetical protein
MFSLIRLAKYIKTQPVPQGGFPPKGSGRSSWPFPILPLPMEKETVDILKNLSTSTIAIFGVISLALTIFREVLKKAFTDKDSLKTVVEEQQKIGAQLNTVIIELKQELAELETLNIRNHSEIIRLIERGEMEKLREYLLEIEMQKATGKYKKEW